MRVTLKHDVQRKVFIQIWVIYYFVDITGAAKCVGLVDESRIILCCSKRSRLPLANPCPLRAISSCHNSNKMPGPVAKLCIG